jgi:ATP-dependent DNA helicase DinG
MVFRKGSKGIMKFAVLDFETTGGQPADEIIQVGLVLIENGLITTRFGALVKPSVPIPAFITALTGIDDGMVEDAPPIDEVLMELVPLLDECILVGHNVNFDLGFLQRALDDAGYLPFSGPVLDTMDLLRMMYPSLPSLSLVNVSESLGIRHDRPHQADSDAETTGMVWLSCVDRFSSLPLLTVQRFLQLFDGDGSDLGWFIRELGKLREQAPLADEGDYRYYRQFALKVGEWGGEEEIRPTEDEGGKLPDSFDDFYTEFREALKNKFAHYEEREAQEQMIREVNDTFDGERHLMIEAGTGTGKSLGYLVPSLYYGIRQDKKVLVSTHTINLQEQIRDRDVPLLQDIFPVPFRAAVLKGRNHYLCLRKFEQKVEGAEFDSAKEERIIAAQMIVWLTETQHGDDEELHLGGRGGGDFWRSVSSDADSCLNRSCPWFKTCFYHRAKHNANQADVVITNHSLLFTDVKAEHRLLPSYKHLVIDEAHHFEEVASKHLGIEVGYAAFANQLAWLYKDSRNGQLPSLRAKLSRAEGTQAEQALEWQQAIEGMYPDFVKVREAWETLAALLFDLACSRNDASGDGGQNVLRIRNDDLPRGWEQLMGIEDNLHISLGGILRKLERWLSEWKDVQELLDIQSLVTDIGGTVKELNRQRDALRFFIKRTDPDYVYWLEASPFYKLKSLQLVSVPTDVSPLLQQYFFEAKDSVVMTSATLSVDRTFDYTCQQLGLDPENDAERLRTVQLPSPFNYREQALVCIPRDFPGIKGAGGEAYFVDRLIRSLEEVAAATNGRMLVLFTSYKMLKLVYTELKERLAPHGIEVLGQGLDSGSRTKLTRMFQSGGASVLLGTSSFWEGVDIPGEALSCLAIVRLPFQPPNHPVAEAKSEKLKKLNRNPFMKLSVPQAVIRFKQGFGRLVRTAKDRGIVILYDTRVIDTSYGKYFLYSLPGPKIEHMNTEQIVPRIREWMGESGIENVENF